MSEMNFPSSPSDGDEYRKWVYNASSGSWVLVDVESDLEEKLDSEHAWNISEHSGIDSDLDARIDSEHAWNVTEHNALQASIDSLWTDEGSGSISHTGTVTVNGTVQASDFLDSDGNSIILTTIDAGSGSDDF